MQIIIPLFFYTIRQELMPLYFKYTCSCQLCSCLDFLKCKTTSPSSHVILVKHLWLTNVSVFDFFKSQNSKDKLQELRNENKQLKEEVALLRAGKEACEAAVSLAKGRGMLGNV